MKAVFLSLVVLAAFCMLSRSSAVQAAGVALSTSSSPINRKDTTTSTTPIEDSPPAHPTALSPKSQYLQSRKSLANLVEEVSAFIHEEEGSSQVPRPRKESPPSTLQEPEEAEKKKEEEEIVLGDEDRRPLLKIALRSGRKSLPAPPVFTPHNAEYNHVPMHRVMGKSPLFSPHKSSSEIRLKSHLQYSPPSPPANSVRSRQSLPEITNKIKNGRISLRQRVATVAAVSTPISADQSSGSVPAGDLEDQPITTSFFYNIITMWNKLPSIFKKSKNKKVAEKVVEVLNPVFGGDLDKLMIDGTHVPKILSDCARIILEVGGLETQGIFRESASKTELDAIKKQYNTNNDNSLLEIDYSIITPHHAAGLIKSFFRDLSSPILPTATLDILEKVMASTSDKINIINSEYISSCLSLNVRITLDYLFDLLNKVASNQHYTKMTGRNLAIVFATNLVSQTLPPQDYMRLSFEGGAVFEFVRLAVEEYHQFKFLIK